MNQERMLPEDVFAAAFEAHRLGLASNRRTFLKLSVLMALASACSVIPKNSENPTPALVTGRIRRAEGEWTSEEVESLATAMMAEIEFENIALAGSMLLKNQQGKKSFSEMSPLFTDDPLTVVTRNNSLPINERFRGAMAITIRETDPWVNTTLSYKDGQNSINFTGATKLRVENLIQDADALGTKSDFLIKFFAAKEILNIKAFDLATDIFAKFFSQYQLPQDEASRNAARLFFLRTMALKGKYSEMPLRFMADVWGHFLMVPDYVLAKERGRFTSEDLAVLSVFDILSKFFLEYKLLVKDQNGKYVWTEDTGLLYGTWVDRALITHAAYLGISPPSK